MDATSIDDDRISQLPEFIIHHIMSFFDYPDDRLQMSALSKNWLSLTTSFPILDFDIREFNMSRQSFFKYVENTTSKFCNQNVTSAHTLKLVTTIEQPSEVDIIDKCFESIVNKGVQVMFINLSGDDDDPVPPLYRLPNILLSASSLTSLRLYYCGLPSSVMTVDAIKFYSLKLLCLSNVHLDEGMMKRLTTNCPLLDQFELVCCHGFKIICINRHQNLQLVYICLEHRVERIDIEAPNLRHFHLRNNTNRNAPLLKLGSCKNLTRVTYFSVRSPNATLFPDFLSSFRFIVDLDIGLSEYCKNITFSSSSLRTFKLSSECDLEEINLDTPNLVLFVYKHCAVRTHAPLESNSPRMECYPVYDVDDLWFQRLRRFLGKKKFFKVLKLDIDTEEFMDIMELHNIYGPAYELEHVELEMENMENIIVYLDVVEAVLWCCRPRSLTLKSKFSVIDYEKRSQIVEYTCKMFLEQEDEAQTNIKIVLSSASKPEKHISNSFLTASPRVDKLTQTITFIKEDASPLRSSTRMEQ